MKFLTLLLCAVFYASAILLVNAKHNDDNKSTMVTVKPTAAPVMSSTAKPPKGPPKHVSPTKPMIAKRSQPLTTTTKSPTTSAPATEKEMKFEALPLAMPATVETPQKPAELQPLAVTGFITRNGSIYEITDKNGIGQIQGRQASDDDTNAEHVCNYGPVVIYSDVPCDRVTNVKVKEYETTHNAEGTSNAPAAQETTPTETKPTETKPTENGNENSDDKETEDKEDLTEMKKPARRRPNKKRANKNKNTQKQKQQKNKKRISNQNNQVRYGSNNNENKNRRRLQQQEQQQEQKRRNQQKRRRQQAQQQDNRRKWQEDEDDYDEPPKPIRRKPNKSQRRQQADRYTSDYEDY